MMIKNKIHLISLFFALFPVISSATVITLYDEASNELPQQQSWLSYATFGAGATATYTADGVLLQTDTSVSAGYSNYSFIPFGFKNAEFPQLDSSTGFTLNFSMALTSEDHSLNSNRAGFSVILLDKNNKGVELGFWEDSIWSQSDSPLFNAKDEEVSVSSGSLGAMKDYGLTLFDDGFFLTQEGTLILSGALKDYSSFSGSSGTSLPYSLGSYLFLGDDTSSASADVTVGRISISDSALYVAPIPLPPSLGFMFLSLFGLLGFQQKKQIVKNQV